MQVIRCYEWNVHRALRCSVHVELHRNGRLSRSFHKNMKSTSGIGGGGAFAVVPGAGPIIKAGGASYVGMALGVGSIPDRSATSAIWSPGLVEADADAAGRGVDVLAIL